MIELIVGYKGSGKTKQLISLCNKATDGSDGNIVFIEKEGVLIYDVPQRARLVVVDEYGVKGHDEFYGFISGMCAGDYDITDFFIDSTLKLLGQDLIKLEGFVSRLDKLSEKTGANITLSISAEPDNLPDSLKKYARSW